MNQDYAKSLQDAKSSNRVRLKDSEVAQDMQRAIQGEIKWGEEYRASRIVLATLGRQLTTPLADRVDALLKEEGISTEGPIFANMADSARRRLLKKIDRDLRRDEREVEKQLEGLRQGNLTEDHDPLRDALGTRGAGRLKYNGDRDGPVGVLAAHVKDTVTTSFENAFDQSMVRMQRGHDDNKARGTYEQKYKEDVDEVARRMEMPFSLEKPQGTSMHHLIDWISDKKSHDDPMLMFLKSHFHSFVVEHDWAKAFEGSKDFDGGEVHLPFDFTCFEFRINGLRVLIPLGRDGNDSTVGCMITGVNKHWYVNSSKFVFRDGKLIDTGMEEYGKPGEKSRRIIEGYLDRIGAQIRAICIMLDAGVAEGQEVKPSEGQNKKRSKEGKLPLRSYHVVRLLRKYHGTSERGDGTGTHKRLHWRRGHWRHYDSPVGQVKYTNDDCILVSKTWINWQLVGDPDLGFVDKHYRL